MRQKWLATTASLALLLGATDLFAQEFDFVADYVRYDDPNQWLTVEGDVQVNTDYGYFYPSRIEYDIENEKIYVDGRLQGVLPTGERFTARYAELDAATQSGILRDMKAFIADELQMGAGLATDDGRITYLENVVASTCTVCRLNPIPLWQFVASQVYRDRDSEKVYIHHGRFEIYGFPVGWIPYLRIPDSSAVRMDGFLNPRIIASSTDVKGIKFPYYIPFNEQTDLTLTPFISAKVTEDEQIVDTQIVEGEFRRVGRGYSLVSQGLAALNDGSGDLFRYYVNHLVRFKLTPKIRGKASFSLQSDYDLASEFGASSSAADYLFLESYENHYSWHGEVKKYRPQSEAGKNADLTFLAPHVTAQYTTILDPKIQLNATGDFLHSRKERSADITRMSAQIDGSKRFELGSGVSSQLQLGARLNGYDIQNSPDDSKNGTATLLTPYAALDLKYPLMRQSLYSQEFLTPQLSLAWSDEFHNGVERPNIDSQFADHDYVSLFSVNQLSGKDQFESGIHGSLGVAYKNLQSNGQSYELGLGKIWSHGGDLTDETTYYDRFEDWVGYANYQFDDEWTVYWRFAFDDEFTFNRSELELEHQGENGRYSLEWVRIEPEPEIGFKDVRSQISSDGWYQFAPNFQVNYDMRYDLEASEMFDAELALTYGNECIEVKAGVSWDFPLLTGLKTEKSYSMSVNLLGITKENKNKWAAKQCRY